MYICDFSRSVGAGSATTRKTRGLTRSVIALIVPPLPAVSRPSKTMQTLAPDAFTHSCIATSSPCRRRSSLLVLLALHLIGFGIVLRLGHQIRRGPWPWPAWNSASLITPFARRSASLAISSAALPRRRRDALDVVAHRRVLRLAASQRVLLHLVAAGDQVDEHAEVRQDDDEDRSRAPWPIRDRSWLRKMSLKTMISSQIQMKNRKNQSIDQKTWPVPKSRRGSFPPTFRCE